MESRGFRCYFSWLDFSDFLLSLQSTTSSGGGLDDPSVATMPDSRCLASIFSAPFW